MANNSRASGPFKNAILSKLSPEVIQSLSPQTLELPVNLVLYEPDGRIEYAFFPEHGVLSVVSTMENGTRIEVGTVGREGMVGSVVLLGAETVPYRHFVQVAGDGYRVSADRFKQVAQNCSELREAILRYEAGFRTQSMQGMACNGLHSVEQRCCRWLLMTRDRVDSDDLKLTHEFLALMLGVRRATVTEVLAPLQAAGLVHSNRGTISILNRSGLESRVCECYWIMVKRDRAAVA